ncbi:MAG: hypothetical protein ACK41E_00770 [Deinococcales bacterium]
MQNGLELAKLPKTAGVAALLEVLANTNAPISVGQVCGGRVSAVWLGEDLHLVSCTLEPFELGNSELCRSKALEFIAQLPKN